MTPEQEAALKLLRSTISELDSYEGVPTDDSYVCLDENDCLTQLNDDEGTMLQLGHLRLIAAIQPEPSA